MEICESHFETGRTHWEVASAVVVCNAPGGFHRTLEPNRAKLGPISMNGINLNVVLT